MDKGEITMQNRAGKKIGCYVRVSTTDKQTTRSQRHAISEWSERSHVRPESLKWYEDKASGGSTANRPALARLLADVDAGRVDTVIVYSLCRFARNTQDGLQILATLGRKGIRVVSVSENIDFGSSVGNLIATVLLAVASFQRSYIVERIKAGLAATDKRIGRPRNVAKLAKIRAMRQSGLSVSEIAEKLRMSRQNAYNALAKTEVAA